MGIVLWWGALYPTTPDQRAEYTMTIDEAQHDLVVRVDPQERQYLQRVDARTSQYRRRPNG